MPGPGPTTGLPVGDCEVDLTRRELWARGVPVAGPRVRAYSGPRRVGRRTRHRGRIDESRLGPCDYRGQFAPGETRSRSTLEGWTPRLALLPVRARMHVRARLFCLSGG